VPGGDHGQLESGQAAAGISARGKGSARIVADPLLTPDAVVTVTLHVHLVPFQCKITVWSASDKVPQPVQEWPTAQALREEVAVTA
jgi:hypothetical protein